MHAGAGVGLLAGAHAVGAPSRRRDGAHLHPRAGPAPGVGVVRDEIGRMH